MGSTASIKDEAMKALEASLVSSIELSKSLETKLSVRDRELATARIELNKFASEAREQQAALAERDETIALLKAEAQESQAESEQTWQRLMALRQAGQDAIGRLGPAVLSAQEASAKPRPLEEAVFLACHNKLPPEEDGVLSRAASTPEHTHTHTLSFTARHARSMSHRPVRQGRRGRRRGS